MIKIPLNEIHFQFYTKSHGARKLCLHMHYEVCDLNMRFIRES